VADPLSLAALNPDAAARAEVPTLIPDSWSDEFGRPGSPAKKRDASLVVYVDPPSPRSRWRFFLFWCLIKLAARVYKFNFEVYRNSEETQP
jgi:hypothetical protein